MLRLAGVALSVGLADSLNPSTVGPALYLATGRHRVVRVTLFTIGVFSVNLAAGIALTLGPGRLLLGLIPHPQGTVRHAIELLAGVVLLAFSAALWLGRQNLARRELPIGHGGSALIAGVAIAAVELPTAAPYLAVIAAIVASSATAPQAIGLVVAYCVAFVAPLVAIIVILLVAGKHTEGWLQKGRAWFQRQWPVVCAVLLLLIGSSLTVLGGAGLLNR